MIILLIIVAFIVSIALTPVLARRLKKAGLVGQDEHCVEKREISEMGGLALVAGFGSGILFAIAAISFLHAFDSANFTVLLAALSMVLMTGLIGLVDDLLGMHQGLKALMPMFTALPLMAVRAGTSRMVIPLLGGIDLWIFYPLVVIPVGVTVAANAVNMLAGFNGLEVGLGIVSMASLAIIAAHLGEVTSLILLLSGLGALVGVLYFNWYPAKVFVGDVGTLSIGAIIAAAVIVGNFEIAGVIVIIPYAIDFLFKAANRFPKSFGELRDDGKLHCPANGPVGLGQFIMKLAGGIHERTLVLVLMGVEAVFGGLAIAAYLWC